MNDRKPQNRLSAFLKTTLTLLITVFLAVSLGAGVYYTASALLPRIREQYVEPVRDNTARLESLSARLDENLENLKQRLNELSGRINQGEITLDQQKITQAALASDLTALEATQSSLKETALAGESRLSSLESQLQTLSTQSARSSELLSYLATQRIPPEALTRQEQITVLRELLLRAKISLNHENFGLVREDLEQGVKLLDSLQAELPPYQLTYTQDLQSILVTALEALTDSPELSADALDLAWRMAAQGLPSRLEAVNPTRTMTPELSPSPSPSSTPTPSG